MLKKELLTTLSLFGVVTFFTSDVRAVQTEEKVAGYNHSANVKIENGWNIGLTADYLYWKLTEDMPPIASLINTSAIGASSLFNGTGSAISLNPTYKTGFQVGVELDLKGMDNWSVYAEYTWYQNKTRKSVLADSEQRLVIDSNHTPKRYARLAAEDLRADFRLHYNAVDLSLERSFYSGKKLTSLFGMGLKGLWLSQKYLAQASRLSYFERGDFVLMPELGFFNAGLELKSWALGPRCILKTNWLLGLGFSLQGDLSSSVLYTRYTKQKNDSVSFLSRLFISESSAYNTLRAVTETSLGLGWGSYLGKANEVHFDLSASYEFKVFWSQGIASMNGGDSNFYLQGLNVAAGIDF